MELDYKSVSLEIKREPDSDGRFEGYASVFGALDRGMDIVERGAFAESIKKRKPKMLWQHDTRQVIGVWEDVREDERGLYVKGRLLNDVEKGREALALMKAGAIDSMSIGYRTVEAEDEGRVRKLKKVELWEVSVVTFPMLPDAKITAVKSIKTIRDFEKALRDAGFSQTEAKAIAADGFKGLADHRDDVEVEADSEGFKALDDQIRQLQEKFHV
jgi:uncharacterized protein